MSGSGILTDGLYIMYLDLSDHYVSFNVEKQSATKTSYLLWHKCLGHIFQKIIKRLEKEGVIPQLKNEFTDCVACIKGKMTQRKRTGSVRSQTLLDLVHTNICGPFPTPTF